ncbi:T9SS type A sorting domain-containing protein [Chryseobacterium arthrosphaerae]|uniref:T9SS type A sorting domain-containing protein n=1 Tax=Chryseobacterium arthrosphaerae TaxID=651561 RepID=UPI001E5604D6|nr:T9SS type A sorting domain-containing protein [Chryseobacterium arthrosphaerae]UEQ78754.1 T9SS type A sorting domain-containing protein [Chryseobacterium arthrosphaerae]
MKKIFLTLCVSGCSIAYAQHLNFSDAKFKALLLSSNATNHIVQDFNGNSIAIDANGDGEIQLSEAQQVKVLTIRMDPDQAYINPGGNTSDPANIKTAYYNSHLPDGISDAQLFPNLEELYFWNTKAANISFSNNSTIKKVQGRPFYYDLSQGGQYIASPINLSFDHCPGIQDIADVIAYQISGNPWSPDENSLRIKNCQQINGNALISSAELRELYIENSSIQTITFDSCKFLEKIAVPHLNTLTKIAIKGGYFPSTTVNSNQNIELIANNCTNLQEVIADTDHYDSNGSYFSAINLNGCSSLKKIKGLNTPMVDFSAAGLTNLEELDCAFYNRYAYYTTSGVYFGDVNTLNLAGLPKLKVLKAFNQKIANNVNFSAAQALENIDVTNTCGYMNTVDVSNLSLLHTLKTDRFMTGNTQGPANLQNIVAKNCITLTNFEFGNNQDLRKLDLENCPELQNLSIGYMFSNLENINLSQCTGFKDIKVSNTKITSLDTKDCVALQSLNLYENSLLNSVNMTNNTNLEFLSLADLPLLAQVNTSDNINLSNVRVHRCPQIHQLDFSTSSHLESLVLSDMTNLASVNLRNGSIEEFVDLNNNNSNVSVCVDDAQLSDLQTMYPDIIFTTDCGNSFLKSDTAKINTKQIRVFPNPVKDILQVSSDTPIKNIQLIDSQGRIILNRDVNRNIVKIDLSGYHTAVYFIKVTTDKKQVTEKIIKK